MDYYHNPNKKRIRIRIYNNRVVTWTRILFFAVLIVCPRLTNADTIQVAARQGRVEEVKRHIQAGADVNAIDESGWAALMWASARGLFETAKLLIESGADPYFKNKYGNIAIMIASANGFTKIVELLENALVEE